MMLVGIGETLLLFPRQVHKSILGFLEIQDPGFFLDHEDPKIPTMYIVDSSLPAALLFLKRQLESCCCCFDPIHLP
jgi:hypothetical protein